MDKVQELLNKYGLGDYKSFEEEFNKRKTMTHEEKLLEAEELRKRANLNYKQYLENKRLELGDDEFDKYVKSVRDSLKNDGYDEWVKSFKDKLKFK